MRRVAGAAIGVLLLVDAAVVQAQSTASAAALRKWADAVARHAPGHPDDGVEFVARLGYRDRVELNPAMELFFKMLRGARVIAHSPGQAEIVDLFESIRVQPGVTPFLRRAAVLHTDAAIFAERVSGRHNDAPPPPRPGPGQEKPPPLLSRDTFVQQTDGRVSGEVPADWNWPFARSLVDVLDDRPFVGEWYHGVAAFMLASGGLADLKEHLAHAADVLPDDARVAFDRGCRAEALGLPYNQAVRDDSDYSKAGALLPSETKTNGEAEAMFRRAVQLDPGYVEARVRLARLLQLHGAAGDAAAEIDRALASHPTRVVSFLAHLTGGRIEQSRGRARESLAHYEAALALFPDAQSALLGASHAAVMAADVPAALSFVHRLNDRTAMFEADPWWSYHLGAGRDVDDLMRGLWSRVAPK